MYPIRARKTTAVDMDALLAPIAPEEPAGESLRYEGTYDQIAGARIEDDPVLSQGVWKIDLKRADWHKVAQMCIDAISTKSKDMQIAAWLCEAWVHTNGFAGMNDGLQVILGLCDNYWDELHPQSDFDPIEYKVAPLIWMNEKLPVLLKLLPVTSPQSDDVKAYCWADWELACRPVPSEERNKNDLPTQALFQQSAMLTPAEHFSAMHADVEACMDSCAALEAFLQDRCDDQAPSLRQIWKVFESVRGFLSSTLSQRDVVAAPPVNSTAPEARAAGPAVEDSEHSPASYIGPLKSRADAYRRLAEAADYLARTEPHSPTPYLVRRAIAWGSLRFEDLIPELVRNGNELGEIYRLLQIEKHGK